MLRLTRSLLVALLALPLTSGGGALRDPILDLRAGQQISSARFELAHATSSVWRVRWARPAAELQLVLASKARAPDEAGQLRELTVRVVGPEGRPLSLREGQALSQAVNRLARRCALLPVGFVEHAPREVTTGLRRGAAPACLVPVPVR